MVLLVDHGHSERDVLERYTLDQIALYCREALVLDAARALQAGVVPVTLEHGDKAARRELLDSYSGSAIRRLFRRAADPDTPARGNGVGAFLHALTRGRYGSK